MLFHQLFHSLTLIITDFKIQAASPNKMLRAALQYFPVKNQAVLPSVQSGKRFVTDIELRYFAKVLKVSYEELLAGDDPLED